MSKVSVDIRVVVHREADGTYWGEVPSLPGCYSQAVTRGQLLENMREAIACHLEAAGKPRKKPGETGGKTQSTKPKKTKGA